MSALDRKALAALAACWALACLAAGCRNEPYCLTCGDGGSAGYDARPEVGPADVPLPEAGPADVGPEAEGPDGCSPDRQEACNGADDNCDGRTDEGFDFQSDPRNCGGCAPCALPHAIPSCQAGVCVVPPDGCDVNFYDLNGRPDDGCEYGCFRVPGATNDATCDNRDDDCDGRRDEDVDLCADANNCGGCGRVCALAHATSSRCVADVAGTCTPAGTHCEVGVCEPGHYDLNGRDDDGCEYACTPSGPERCNGLDDNCDGQADEGMPETGQPCGSAVGQCRQGATACNAGRLTCANETGPSPELCNGLDDDCDGAADEDVGQTDVRVGAPCGNTTGDCSAGRQACVAGALACQGGTPPAPEACDGRDNDCNGQIDDGVPAGGACGIDTGECTAGQLRCVGGTTTCSGGRGRQLETCNGLDDDCDGAVDNGFDLARDNDNCGRCGNSCAAVANAVSGCQAGSCAIVGCNPGFYNLDGIAANGCEYVCNFTGSVEVCNGLDDNCNGQTDEGVTAPNFCRQVGPCAGVTPTCAGTRGFVCNYPAAVEVDPSTGQPVAVETRCDNVDNNCNGMVDESFAGLGQSCSNGGVGACVASGRLVCNSGGTGTTCNAPPPTQGTAETCDGLDNDCDGLVDESRLTPGTNASFVPTAWVAVSGTGTSTVWMMQYEASRPGASAAAPGAATATSRACSAAGVIPWTNLTPAQAAAACSAAHPSARLCTEAEWQGACVVNATSNCRWSYASTCRTYASRTCNDTNNDVDVSTPAVDNGLLATGALASCYANDANGRVFDLSGNAREFTAPRSAGVNPVRGGSYNNLADGTQCTFNWSVVADDFSFVNTGFRCCFTGATAP